MGYMLLMKDSIYKILFYVILILIFYYLYRTIRRATSLPDDVGLEHFDDKLDYSIEYVMNEYNKKNDDIYDKEYVDLYDIAYHDFHDIDRDMKVVIKHCPTLKSESQSSILIGGCGVGKLCHKWKEHNPKSVVYGVDFSKHMLKKAEGLYPNIKYIRGNLADPKLFDSSPIYDLYMIDERTLYMNHEQDMERILQNANRWLKDEGILVVPVYDKNELQLASRYYSTTYIDHLGLVHGFTYLDHFSHDCWYVPDVGDGVDIDGDGKKDIKGDDEKSERLTLYFDKFTTKDGKKRIKTTMFYFLPKDEVYQMILRNGFEKIHIEPICTQIVGGYELAIFKKKKNVLSVKEIQKRQTQNQNQNQKVESKK